MYEPDRLVRRCCALPLPLQPGIEDIPGESGFFIHEEDAPAESLLQLLQPQTKCRAPRSAVKPVHAFSQLSKNDNREKHAVLGERFQPALPVPTVRQLSAGCSISLNGTAQRLYRKAGFVLTIGPTSDPFMDFFSGVKTALFSPLQQGCIIAKLISFL